MSEGYLVGKGVTFNYLVLHRYTSCLIPLFSSGFPRSLAPPHTQLLLLLPGWEGTLADVVACRPNFKLLDSS